MVHIIHVVDESKARLVICVEEAVVVLMQGVSLLHLLELFNAKHFAVVGPGLLQLPVVESSLNDGLVHDIQIHLVLGFVLGRLLQERRVRLGRLREMIAEPLTLTFWLDYLGVGRDRGGLID